MKAHIAPLLAICTAYSVCAHIKPYRLKILNIVDSSTDVLYRNIAQIVADTANSRLDILPEYYVEMEFVDDDYGTQAPAKFINFERDLADKSSNNFAVSPIVIGPQYSTGCKAVRTFLEPINMVAVSGTCAAAVLSDRSRYWNLYVNEESSYFTGPAALVFMREQGWNRFALLTYALNVNDYASALQMYKIAVENSFSVLWFSMVADVNEELVASLKATGARVIALYSSLDWIVYKCLCLAHNMGMKGSRYVFIAGTGAAVDPMDVTDETYPHCTRSIILEQSQQTFFVGTATDIADPSLISELGHTQNDFNTLLQNSTNSDDPERYSVYDGNIRAIFALHDTEQELKRQNLSLRDYRKFPGRVMKVANQSLSRVNITGLHTRNLFYNKEGLPGGDSQGIVQWSRESGFVTFTVAQHETSTGFNLSGYNLKHIGKIKWSTTNQKAPRDYEQRERQLRTVPNSIFIIVTVFSALSTAAKFFIAVGSRFVKKLQHNAKLSQQISYLGFILIDASAICYVYDSQPLSDSHVRWISAIALLLIGLSTANSGLTMLAMIYKFPRFHMLVSVLRKPGQITRRSSVQVRLSTCDLSPRKLLINWKKGDKVISSAMGLYTLVNITILIAWFIADPLVCKQQSFREPIYLTERDVVIETLTEVCASENMKAWLLALTFFHVLLLVAGSWVGYTVSKRHAIAGFVYIRFGLANSLTIILCTLLVLVVIRDVTNQQIAIAFAALVHAMTSALVWLIGTLKSANS